MRISDWSSDVCSSDLPEDRYAGIADPGRVARDWPAIEMFDPTEPSAETLVERARAAEDAARAVAGITNSEGAEASWGRSEERRVGNACVSTVRSRGSQIHDKKTNQDE